MPVEPANKMTSWHIFEVQRLHRYFQIVLMCFVVFGLVSCEIESFQNFDTRDYKSLSKAIGAVEIESENVLRVRALVGTGEHGLYILAEDCISPCSYVYEARFSEENIGDEEKLLKYIQRNGESYKTAVPIYMDITLNLLQVPNKDDRLYYKISSVNIVDIYIEDRQSKP